MKKYLSLTLLAAFSLSTLSCNKGIQIDMSLINKELQGCYNYFKATTNLDEDSLGYGLTRDRYTSYNMASIAATGFLLASYPVFVEEGYMEKANAKSIVDKTFDTILRIQEDPTTTYAGCISHFVGINNGKRSGTSEVSTIDTAILVSGAISASEYFDDDTLRTKSNAIWGNVDFNQFTVTRGNKSYISMGVDDPEEPTQLGAWDYYAEQLMIYILGAGNPNRTHRITSKFYKDFTKHVGEYDGIEHVHSWFGSIFTYQYSHAFYNFKKYNDYKGINYFENSVKASQTAYKHSQALARVYKSFSEDSWGLTACDTPLGYNGELGHEPRGWGGYGGENYRQIQGTVAPTGAIGSMPFTPVESFRALKYYQTIEDMDSNFGLRDSFNLDWKGSLWVDTDWIGIDKGIEVLQMYNYKNTDFVSNLSMNNPYVIEGFVNNEFVEVK